MPLKNLNRAPFWWYGGKSDAADIIWRALGDVAHYVEPFCGSCAVLLRRPHLPNRQYYSETVNDIDGFIANFWRAVTADPQAVAEACSYPVVEAEMHARHVALVRWINDPDIQDRLAGDVTFYDAKVAGWWVWGHNCWIGGAYASGNGAWWPDEHGVLRKRKREKQEPGVNRSIPQLGTNGRGINQSNAREPGVNRSRPQLIDNGRGVNQPNTREPGVERFEPPLSVDEDWQMRVGADYEATGGFHPMTMPEIRRWMAWLSARLRHVRVLNGDWTRACTLSAVKTLSVREGRGAAGVFLDPPYTHSERDPRLYRVDQDVAAQVREWCIQHGNDPDIRIVLAGYEGEGHEVLVERGWREVSWFRDGYLKGGMGNRDKNKKELGTRHQQHRERLWLSPHCLPVDEPETTLWTSQTSLDT